MKPEQWQQAREVLADALELKPEDRSAFLDHVCSSDHALRQEVEHLLSSSEEARSGFLQTSALRVTLTPGTKLGDYEVKGLLGSGGMGEVYRALDTRLGRDIAIKVLPGYLSQDPDRLRRFEQEARAAAALNHPNILAVFQMGTYEGAPYLVSELLEGTTFREQLLRGAMPFRKAIDVGVQIARGLAAAHEKGIVHRDLKPENLFITKDGRVKILDFGLAKLTQRGSISDHSAATVSEGTEPGVVMGTVGYMAPEQVRGGPADYRADIFAFGTILYEMLTGERAFQKRTSAETMSAILNDEPSAISQIVPNLPLALQRMVHRCLEKNPAQRFQSASDLGFALEALSDSGGSSAITATQSSSSRKFAWIITAVVVLSLAVAMTAWWFVFRPSTPPVLALSLTRLTSDSGLTTDPALSSDGKLLAYASDRSGEGNLDIYMRQIGGGEPLRLTRGPGDKHEPVFSPDGTAVAFRSEQSGSAGIYMVSALGGIARRIVPDGDQPRFSPDGKWLSYSIQLGDCFDTGNLCKSYVVPSSGGEPRQLRPDFAAAYYAVWSPDGKHLLFFGNRDQKLPREEGFDWYVTPFDSGPAIKTGVFEAMRDAGLSGPPQDFRWMLLAPVWQGDTLIFSARFGDSANLWRIGISPKTWKAIGLPQRLTSGAAEEGMPSVASVAAGMIRLAFASEIGNQHIWSLPVESNQGRVTGELKQLTLGTGPDFHPALSPDGTKMVWVSARSGDEEIWIRDLRTGEDSPLTASHSDKWLPRFSPDGSRISFSTNDEVKQVKQNIWNVYVLPVTGGTPDRVCEDCGEATGWSRDGKYIIGNRLEGQAWLLDVASKHRTDLFTTRQVDTGAVSPDNRWFSFSPRSGRTYIAPFGQAPVPESSWVPAVDGGWNNVEWSPDGNLTYMTVNRDGFTCIWGQHLDRVTKRPVGPPFSVFHAHKASLSLSNQVGGPELAVGRDKILFNTVERTGNIWMAEWKEQ